MSEKLVEELRQINAMLREAQFNLDLFLERKNIQFPDQLSEASYYLKKSLEHLTSDKVLDWLDEN